MQNGFSALKVCAHTVEQLQKMGITRPMPVQEQAIPALFAGRDVIGEYEALYDDFEVVAESENYRVYAITY